MTIQETIESVRSSFAMEDFIMTEEDRERGIAILSDEKSIEEVIQSIKDEITSRENCNA